VDQNLDYGLGDEMQAGGLPQKVKKSGLSV
jgi:hypothetical protein